MWFDKSSTRPLADKITQAATRYQVKFGVRPNLCYLNPGDLNPNDVNGDEVDVPGVELRTAANIQPWHLWIGVES